MPHCSLANRVPVRPKPTATSSAISSTSCSRQAAASAATSSGSASCMPAAPCTSGSMTTAASSAAWAATRRTASAKQSGIGEGRGPEHREAQRVEHVGAEPARPEGDRPDRVAVVGVAEGQVRGPAGDALVGPELEGDLQGLLDGRGAVAGEEHVGVVDGHDRPEGLGQLDDDPVAVAQQRGVGHAVELVAQGLVQLGHPVAERGDPQRGDGVEVAAAVDVDQLPALGPATMIGALSA